MTSTSSDSVVDELKLLFVSLGLGKISVEGRGPRFKLTIKDCSGCTLTETILRAIFEERLGVESNVKLLSRRGKEACMKTCKFMVALGPNPSEEQ